MTLDWMFSSELTPHGFCLVWDPWLIWAFVIGDAGTGLAYAAIPLALVRFVRRRDDVEFKPVFWLFAAFILLCSTTHWLELVTIWMPVYRLEAVAKLTTAAVSIATTVALWRLLPKALALPSPGQMRVANEALAASEGSLRALNTLLEAKVEERTRTLLAHEARQSDLLATLDLGAFIARDPGGTIRFWSEGCTRLYGWQPEQAVGRHIHDLLRTQFPVPQARIEAALERDGEWSGDLRQHASDMREVVVAARKVLRRDAAGQPLAVLEILSDVTEARQTERERRQADTLLRGIIASAPGLIYAKDRQSRMLLANDPVVAFVGKSWDEIQGRTDLELLDDRAQAETIVANDRRIMESGQTEALEELVGTEGGQPRVWLSTKTPLRGPEGQVEGMVGVSIEITERKRAEARLLLMVHELNHRVKNTLVSVQSIASHTLRGADPALRLALEDRLHALAAAHDVLTNQRWEGADLHDVVAGALAPFGGEQGGRFRVAGPPVRLLPRAALALAMGLHELATNAVKYGALSPGSASGWVELRWSTAEGRLRLAWSEHDGPEVAAPQRRGFGTRMVERSLAQDLAGVVTVAFESAGLVCTLDAPLNEAAVPLKRPPLPRVGCSAGVDGGHLEVAG